MNSNQAIGIFDSGVGGLTIAKAIHENIPNESIIYFGDSKHLFYGDKSKKIILQYSKNISEFLLAKECKAIVIACNTVSANAVDEIKDLTHGKAVVFDVISPIVKKISYQSYQRIAVIGTKATINSHIYKKCIHKLNPYIEVIELATPLLAPVIEEGFYNHPISNIVLSTYLLNLKSIKIDAIILGCTHYPMISLEVKKFFNESVQVIDSPKIVADYLFYKLRKMNLLNKELNPKNYFYLSHYTEHFVKNATMIFNKKIKFEQIHLEK